MSIFQTRLKASVAIVALVTSSVLVVLSLMLIQIVHFSQFNQYRFSRKLAAQWFLEGRMNETLDGILNKGEMLREGDFPHTEKINGQNQTYDFKISRVGSRDWKIQASMLWQKQIPVQEEVVLHRTTEFDKAFVFNQTKRWKISQNTLTAGSFILNAPLDVAVSGEKNWYAWSGKQEPFWFFPGVQLPARWIGGLKTEVVQKFFDNEGSTQTFKEKPPIIRSIRNQQKLPIYSRILANYRPYFDSSWVIENAGFYTTKRIFNSLDVYKFKIDDGNGYLNDWLYEDNIPPLVYVSRSLEGNWKQIHSIDESYGYGEGTENFLAEDLDKLILKASSEKYPLSIKLPPESYLDFGIIHLRGENFSFISVFEIPKYIALNETDRRGKYFINDDFVYDASSGSVKFTSSRFFKQYVRHLGKGTGTQYTFKLPGIRGNFGVYVNKKRVEISSRDDTSVTLKDAPPKNAEILVWLYPSVVFLSKKPPESGMAVYRDVDVEVVDVNLDEIQNYPEHSVIYSKLPIYLTGKVRENLVVLCDADIYVGKINSDGDGKTLLAVSRTGIWGVLPDDGKLVLKHVMLVSPLDTFPVLNDVAPFEGGKASIFGSLLLTGKNKNRVMKVTQEFPNLIADSQVAKDALRLPFSIFPFPVSVLSVSRH